MSATEDTSRMGGVYVVQGLNEAYRYASDAEDNYFYAESKDDVDSVGPILVAGWSMALQVLQAAGLNVLLEKQQSAWIEYQKDLYESKSNEQGDNYLLASAGLRWLVSTARKLLIRDDPVLAEASKVQLISLLRKAKHFVLDESFGWRPAREQDIDDRIKALLRTAYSTVSSNPSIPNTLKNYRPDTEIGQLNTVIDYKFVESKDGARVIADELSADLHNYHDPRVDHVVFVVYETVRTMPEADWQQHFEGKRPRTPVTVILLEGEQPTDEDRRLSLDNTKKAKKAAANKNATPSST